MATPVLLLVAFGIAGCAGLTDGEATSDSKVSSSGSTTADESGGSSTSSGDSPGAIKQSVSETPLNRAVISTGQISVSSGSISKARAEVLRLVTSYDGAIANEQTDSNRHGRAVSSTLTLRVPTSSFAEAMDSLARVGKVEHQSRQSKDVTTKVLDNEARVRAAERAIRQIEVLLGRANALRDIIAIESDLAQRQAHLDSLKSQQKWLEDQTSLSTINVQLSRPGEAPPEETRGFLAGLGSGWDAMRTSSEMLLTALGAVLPFAVLVALIGVPLRIVLRRRFSAASAPARSA